MTLEIIIASCILILIAYIFDVISFRVKTPSVILLLTLGILSQQLAFLFKIHVPDLHVLLPVFGTVGLILIVLEGALELELDRTKFPIIKKSLILAVIPMFIIAFGTAFAFFYFGHGSYKDCLANAIPFCIISSAVAIPSVRNLKASTKEFIVYESSLSDIFGVVLFNFVALNEVINLKAVTDFGIELFLIVVVTIVATFIIAELINRIKYHVKFTPIIIIIVLVYAIAKTFHLPALIFVMLCGLFLGNILHLKDNKWVKRMHPLVLSRNVTHFREITTEATFVVRILFFILFGFLIDINDIINLVTLPWALGIVAAIFTVRAIFLFLVRMPLVPALFIAPRGLITILLFYNLLPQEKIALVNTSLIIQVVLITTLTMMAGLVVTKKEFPHAETKLPLTPVN